MRAWKPAATAAAWLCAACSAPEPSAPRPHVIPKPDPPQTVCDLGYKPVEIGWDEVVDLSGELPAETLARLSMTRMELSYARDAVALYPWLHDARVWSVDLAPHPSRPPMRVPAIDGCPEMVVFPVAARVEIGGGLIVLENSGRADAPEWGADEGGSDLPWRYGQTSVVRLFEDEVSVVLNVVPGPTDETTWPDPVQESLDQATATWTIPDPTLVAGLGFGGAAPGAGLGARAVASDASYFSMAMASSYGVRTAATQEAPVQCPPSEPVVAGDPSHEAAARWLAAASSPSVQLSWPLVNPPPGDWSTWSWEFEPQVLIHRVHVPDLAGTCEARTVALVHGTIAPVVGALSYDIDLELTLEGEEVAGVVGVGQAWFFPHDPPHEAWTWEVAETLDRMPSGSIPPFMWWMIRDHEISLVLMAPQHWQTDVVVATGHYSFD